MPAALVVNLIATYGLPLAQQLFTLWQNPNKVVTQEEFDTLVALANYRSADALAAAGIKIVDGKVVSV